MTKDRKKFRRIVLLSVIILIAVILLRNWLAITNSPEPGIKWETDEKSLQLSEEDLKTIKDVLKSNRTHEFLIVKNNKIIFEWYSKEFNFNTPHYTASLAKSIIGGVTLILILQEKLLALDDYACKYIPHWAEDSLKSKIKIKHLAMHTSGLEDAVSKPERNIYEEPGWKGEYWREHSKRFQISLNEVPVLSEPGSVISYSNPGITCLSYIFSKVLKESGHPDLKEFLENKIMEPLDIPDHDWGMSYEENYYYNDLRLYEIGGGGDFTARAAAKIGQLMINYGNINGKQILDSTFVSLAINFNENYIPENPDKIPLPGLCWWTNKNKIWEKLPEDSFAGWGGEHQVVLGIPSEKMVLVRFGDFYKTQEDWMDMDKYIFNSIIDFFIDKKI